MEGTYNFLAPEVVVENAGMFSGTPVDIWALGVTLYAMVYFKVPFYEETLPGLFKAIETKQVVYPETPAISPDL